MFLLKHKWKFGRTRNAVETRAIGNCFHQFFSDFPNFHECLYNSIETRRAYFLYHLENTVMKKGKQLLHFNHQNVNSLCLCHHYVNSLSASSLSVES